MLSKLLLSFVFLQAYCTFYVRLASSNNTGLPTLQNSLCTVAVLFQSDMVVRKNSLSKPEKGGMLLKNLINIFLYLNSSRLNLS